MQSPYSKHLPLILGLVFIAALGRLLPHWPNFTPVGAMALFGAAALPKKWLAVLAPLVAFYLSDLLLNNVLYAEYFDGFYFGADPYICLGVAAMVGIGLLMLRGRRFSWLRVGGGAVAATVVFFLLSNFGVWMSGMMYPKTVGGLVACYVAGLPFALNSLAANLVFSGVLFGIARAAGVFGREGQPAFAGSETTLDA